LGKALSAFKRGLREAEEEVQKPMAEATASKPVEHSSEGAAQKTV
jgi:Sec-independent protein translocase protein TatA